MWPCLWTRPHRNVTFFNTYEIDKLAAQYARHPVLGPATKTLAALRDAANAHSDGWCHWPKPARAAANLMALIEGDDPQRRFDDVRADVTATELRKAYVPIKALRTKTGLKFEIYDIPKHHTPGTPRQIPLNIS